MRSPDLHRTAAIFRDRRHCAITRPSADGRDLLQSWRRTWSHHDRLISIGRHTEEELDRAIGTAQRTSSNQTAAIKDGLTIVAHDRGSIVVRSPYDRGYFTAKSGRIHRGIEAMTLPKGIAPTTPAIRSQDRINRP